jgi:hypothetical protein
LAVVAGFIPLASDIAVQVKAGDFRQAGMVAVHNTIGYNGWSKGWDMAGMKTGLFPILAGIMVHKLAGALGVNRMLAAAGIPYLRV